MKKVVILLAILILAVVLFTARSMRSPRYIPMQTRDQGQNTQLPSTNPGLETDASTSPSAEEADPMLAAAAGEEASLQSEEANTALIGSENQTVSEFGQSYVENEF